MMYIVLNNGKRTIVDDENYEELNSFKWGTVGSTHIYVARGTRKKGQPYKKILMHRFITKVDDDSMVDHINGNTLDNRKQNLRIVTRAMNLQNSKLRNDSGSQYKGVGKKVSKMGTIRFTARIQIDVNKRIYLGFFKTEVEAALAYNKAALHYFGEYAKINVINEEIV